MMTLAVKVSIFFSLLTDKEREKVLIFDDSSYDRSRSKAVELLAWIFDHNTGQRLKGFKLLTLGWSDGFSFLPLSLYPPLLGQGSKKGSRYQERTG